MSATGPALSVVICTLGRPERLGALAVSVVAQLGPDDELVVVNQSEGASAETGRAAVEAAGARWVAHQPAGLPGARNRAIGETERPLILFLDDDVHLHRGCIEGHRGAYVDPMVGGVTGRIVEVRLAPNASRLCNEVGLDGRIRTCLDVPEPGPLMSLKGANMSFRRVALLEAGPFEVALGGTALLEDAELSERVRRLAWQLRYVPDAAVTHDHDPVGGVRQQGLRTLRARFRNTGFFVGRHRPRRHLPWVWTTHLAVAVRHGGVGGVSTLMSDLIEGWREGRRSPLPSW